MRLLLDECCAHTSLVRELIALNYDVARSIDCVGQGASDATVLAHAINDETILVTANCGDFFDLAKANGNHPGMLLIYPDANGDAMSTRDIAKAVVNVWQSFGRNAATLRGQRIALRQFIW